MANRTKNGAPDRAKPVELVPRPVDGVVAPHNLHAEASVLGAVLLDAKTYLEIAYLRPEHFYNQANRVTWEAISYLHAAGSKIDIVTVGNRIRDENRLEAIGGGMKFLVDLLDVNARIDNIGAHARIVEKKSRLRQLIAASQMITARAYHDGDDASVVLAEAERSIVEVVRTSAGNLPRISAEAIFAPIPAELPWICKGLKLIAGRVAVIAGYAYSGKTLAAQSLALSIASGVKAWGHFDVDQVGGVVHANWDQPLLDTRYRYHRLARGMNIDPVSLRGKLELVQYPKVTLDDPSGFAEIRALCRGARLLIIDALIGAAGDIDDRDTKIGRLLYELGAISEETGCAILVVHHAIKNQQPGPGKHQAVERDPLQSMRGSGAIAGAAGSVFVLQAQPIKKRLPIKVTHARTPTLSGAGLEPFGLAFDDVERQEGDHGGVRVVYCSPEEMAERSEQAKGVETKASKSKAEKAIEKVHEEIDAATRRNEENKKAYLELLKQRPGGAGLNELFEAGHLSRKDKVSWVLAELEKAGLAKNDSDSAGRGKKSLWRAV